MQSKDEQNQSIMFKIVLNRLETELNSLEYI